MAVVALSIAPKWRIPAVHRVIAVVGPTGSGKSALALSLAETRRGEIVNYDSVQLYRGLDIGSAKLPVSARRGIPHHLLDVIDLDSEMTAGSYARMARDTLAEIDRRGAIPILVGGTGFYLKALLEGLPPAPSRNPELRVRLSQLAKRRPLALHRFLGLRDRAAASRIHPNDHQKLIRAIELTSADRPQQPRTALEDFAVIKIGLAPERPLLNQHLDNRTEQLFCSGLLEETSALLESGIHPDAKGLRSLGYKQAVEFMQGRMTLPDAVRECQTKTRQYAKRQLTWFRKEPNVVWFSGFGTDPDIVEQAKALLP